MGAKHKLIAHVHTPVQGSFILIKRTPFHSFDTWLKSEKLVPYVTEILSKNIKTHQNYCN